MSATNPALPFIRRIFVEEDLLELPYTREILERAGGLPVRTVPAGGVPPLAPGPYRAAVRDGKRTLFLTRNRGRFFKPCPGTREYRCCGYQVLNFGMSCPMDCVYCILQAYLNNPWLSFFVNVEDLLAELDTAFRREPGRFRRIGTGELTDSLALDPLTGLSRILVAFMKDRPRAVLELKTKTANIGFLRDLDHRGRTIVAWSLNSQEISGREEHLTASLEERLRAAAACAARGYPVAFHFDPLVYHPGWQEGYADTVARLFAAVPVEKIVWISLGALRFLPRLKPLALERFPGSTFFHEEFVPGLDGKLRYFRTLRVRLYREVLARIREFAPEVCVYLCMESDPVWQDVFGFSPEEHGGLGAMLDRAAQKT